MDGHLSLWAMESWNGAVPVDKRVCTCQEDSGTHQPGLPLCATRPVHT